MSRTFEDFPVGARLCSNSLAISTEAIIDFGRAFDPQLFHLDPTAAGETLFGSLVASGWQTSALSMRLFVETMDVPGGMIGLAVDELRWPEAVRPGDELQVEIEIVEARLSKSRPGYGIIRYQSLTKNQRGETVQSFFAVALLPASHSTSSSEEKSLGGEGFEPPTNTV